ncbi:MAG TPA: class I SAM-dependent methyltransferase [Bdellovibrionales bacterium]|nr:class I SAM-dependent methyltransferase [Bdellovibrionales bacterium]
MGLDGLAILHQDSRNWALYRCVKCASRLESSGAQAVCTSCRTTFPILHGVLDTLVEPNEEVIREMKGMAREMVGDVEGWKAIKVRLVEKTPELDELRSQTANDPGAYYDQTLMAFEQALRVIDGQPQARVLEVGADKGFHFLKRFGASRSECHALNLHFDIPKAGDDVPWIQKTLGDMNALPYANGVFDVVLLSATSHHSPHLDTTVAEVARVLKPGGVALFLNDQLSGWLKFVNTHTHGRDDLIHENFYSIRMYHRSFTKHGFKPQYLFSDFYDRKLSSGNISRGLRFAAVGKLLSLPWRNQWFREFAKSKLVWPAHLVFGFPLNAVLWKPKTPSPH